ncbi:hypothetical protein [Phycicoccus sp. 3266]|uniref:hypothetical protein n=1 Tax=Phycicoccus sp. 3266 TaxID=2817751 RepID=UPI0028664BB2|nr:hypothetical protein [Phycicoccus sp. 3266]MDR6862160.1 hypothetical protein [Phycicoccus sp. 3266]
MTPEWQRIRKAEYHDDGCPKPQPKLIPMKLGDQLAHCSSCLSRWIVHADQHLETGQPSRRAAHTGFVCRAHFSSVTPGGKGCATCQQEAEARTRRRSRRGESA